MAEPKQHRSKCDETTGLGDALSVRSSIAPALVESDESVSPARGCLKAAAVTRHPSVDSKEFLIAAMNRSSHVHTFPTRALRCLPQCGAVQ